ncbi:DUF3667 domain-containing protein [Pedobacter sp.]|jgi:hypothetical protein|uniref:DUF3667 domain-containing protein n=1 Tax=Pedobacter sp. TaxID=1411316 RepID=UPI002CF775A0|nr:DUF3667 domain-containing protein [Pedobacter sp.]HWW39836.1 DUF3667 domain-containing protein [Pedobacter sp.]
MKEVDNLEKGNKLKRIDSSYIIHEITHLLHLESGFLFTVKQLFIRPGKLVRSFIFEDRSKITKPIIFLIFSATLFTVIFHFFHIKYEFFSLNQKIGNIDQYLEKKALSEWVNNHIGYTSLIIGFFIALWLKVFFRKHNYNIYEITVLLCYSFGQTLLIIVVFSLLEFLLKIKLIAIIGVFTGYFYIFWSIGQFFGEKKIINYVKTILCCILGAISFRLILILLATIFYQLGIK